MRYSPPCTPTRQKLSLCNPRRQCSPIKPFHGNGSAIYGAPKSAENHHLARIDGELAAIKPRYWTAISDLSMFAVERRRTMFIRRDLPPYQVCGCGGFKTREDA